MNNGRVVLALRFDSVLLRTCADQSRGRPPGYAVDHRELGERLNRLVSKSSIGSSLPSLRLVLRPVRAFPGPFPSPTVVFQLATLLVIAQYDAVGEEKSGEDRQRDIELYKVLRGRKSELEELLRTRINELRSVCLREGEITGEMPEEIRATLRPGEDMPKLKKRVGTSFSIPEEILKCDKIAEMVSPINAAKERSWKTAISTTPTVKAVPTDTARNLTRS
ncbi:hypothetical protein ANCCEY_09962 [Ancylostoma ceylanicum]|uniref:Cytohesin Ubiquitin Protein Inducing domain-containing protein n=1 Tax=Ancylostoma ceylanicum TaxID=53326 RepID=A0A0D6LLQ4_9BILA|nr:hypothetical protein ANCCEY_09962 [Ancylostoma ceylanicum]